MAAVSDVQPAARPPLDVPAVLKECAIAAFVGFLLFISLVGIRITEVEGGQSIETRFIDVGAAVALVFIGRLGMALVRAGHPLPVLIGGGIVAAAGTLVPLPSNMLQIICIIGAVVLAFNAARSMRVPSTVLISVAGGAVLLGLMLNLLSVHSDVLELLMLWYGGLAVAIGLSTHPHIADRSRRIADIPVRVIAALAIGAAVLAAVLYALATFDRSVAVTTTGGSTVFVTPLADGEAPPAAGVVFIEAETGATIPVPIVVPGEHDGDTARVAGLDGESHIVAVLSGGGIDADMIGLFVLFYLYVIVAVVAANRFRDMLQPDPGGATTMDRVSARVQESARLVGPILVLGAVALPFLFPDRSTIDLATLVLTYIMLGWGLNIIVGLAGLLDLGYVAFYAVGAYSYALLAVHFDFSFWICLPLAGLFAATAGLILGFPVLRLRGDYFAIVTLGFGEIIRLILLNWWDVTRGPDGIGQIPRPTFFGLAEFTRRPDEDGLPAFHQMFGLEFDGLHRVIFLYYLILILALMVNWTSVRVRKLPIGRAWEALREDDIACQSLGINRRNVKLAAFTFSAMFGGVAGSFFATRQGFISPESFTFIESAIILAIVVLGGMGSQMGVVLAAVLLIGMPEVFRELEQYRMLAFGAAMVSIMVWRPRGLLAHRAPSVRYHDEKRLKRVAKRRQATRGAVAE